jgi:branched-chain amino acid transport system substrate-binding protein
MDSPTTNPTPNDEDAFDAYARQAGAALRSPANESAMAKVVKTGQQRHRTQIGAVLAGLVLLAGGLAYAARSREEIPPAVTIAPAPDPIAPLATTAAPPATTVVTNALTKWTTSYTGNPPGPATGPEYHIGSINQFGIGSAAAVAAAAKYLNAEAGGVGGRPIKIVTCEDVDPTDCLGAMAKDPSINAVLWTGMSEGSTQIFLDHFGGIKPALTSFVCECQEPALNGRTASLQVSHLDAVAASAHLADQLSDGKERIGLITSNGSAEAIVTTILGTTRTVKLDLYGSLSAQHITDELTKSGATDVTRIVADIGFDPCEPFATNLRLALPTAIVVGSFCNEPVEGWYTVGEGFNHTTLSNEAGANSILTGITSHGMDRPLGTHIDEDRWEARAASDLLVLVRIINSLGGPDKATQAQMVEALKNYKGPVPMSQDVDCSATGKSGSVLPGDCQSMVSVHRYVDGKWIDLPPVSALRVPAK